MAHGKKQQRFAKVRKAGTQKSQERRKQHEIMQRKRPKGK